MQCGLCCTLNPVQARFCPGCDQLLGQGIICQSSHTLLLPKARYCFHHDALVFYPASHQYQPADAQAQPGAQVSATPAPATIAAQQPIAEQVTQPSTAEAIPTQPLTPVEEFSLTGLLPPKDIKDMLHSLKRFLPDELYRQRVKEEMRKQADQFKDKKEHKASLENVRANKEISSLSKKKTK